MPFIFASKALAGARVSTTRTLSTPMGASGKKTMEHSGPNAQFLAVPVLATKWAGSRPIFISSAAPKEPLEAETVLSFLVSLPSLQSRRDEVAGQLQSIHSCCR